MNAVINYYTLTIANPSSGARRSMNVFAASEELAELMALRDSSEIVSVTRASPLDEGLARLLFFRQKSDFEDLKHFYLAMQRCLESSGQLLRSLEICIPICQSHSLRYAFAEVLSEIRKGNQPAEAFERLAGVVPAEHIAMLRAGDAAGKVKQVFESLATGTEAAAKNLSNVRTAMIYPVAVLTLGYVGMIGACLFLVPRLKALFDAFHGDLPPLTKALVWMSDQLNGKLWLVALLALVPAILLKNLGAIWVSSPVQSLIQRAPLIRRLTFKIEMGRCMRTFALLLDSKVKFATALEIAGGLTRQPNIRNFFVLWRSDILAGKSPFEAANNNRALLGEEAHLIMALLQTGDTTGTVGVVMGKLAEGYQNDVDETLKGIDALLTPVTLVIVGAFILFLGIAVYLPFLKFNHLILPPRH
jgi:type II secretory pathway component PulF